MLGNALSGSCGEKNVVVEKDIVGVVHNCAKQLTYILANNKIGLLLTGTCSALQHDEGVG